MVREGEDSMRDVYEAEPCRTEDQARHDLKIRITGRWMMIMVL